MPALTPSADQVLIFLAIVEHGSFSAAARALGRTQSSVTYAIKGLEADLGVAVFDRTTRSLEMTPAGRALLPTARRMARELETMRRVADAASRGLEPRVVVVVDALYPPARLVALLRRFQAVFPTVTVRAGVESVHAAAESLLRGEAVLGILGPVVEKYPGLAYLPIGAVERIPVAAPSHPLARWEGEIPASAFRDFVHIVLSSRSRQPRGRLFPIPSSGIWRMNDLALKRVAILDGVGWGRLPLHTVEDDLSAGRLRRLRVGQLEGANWTLPVPLHVAFRSGEVLGPAASWLRDALAGDGITGGAGVEAG